VHGYGYGYRGWYPWYTRDKPYYRPTIKKFTQPGELTHIDLWGPYDVQSIHGNSYFLLMIDDASRFIAVDFLKAKSQAVQKIKDQMTYLSVRDKTPCTIRMDRGTEFVNNKLKTWCHFVKVQGP